MSKPEKSIYVAQFFVVALSLLVAWGLIKLSDHADRQEQKCLYQNDIDACYECDSEGTKEQSRRCKAQILRIIIRQSQGGK